MAYDMAKLASIWLYMDGCDKWTRVGRARVLSRGNVKDWRRWQPTIAIFYTGKN